MTMPEIAGRYTAWQDLINEIDSHDGVSRVPMEALRQLQGGQRVTDNLREELATRLSTYGFGFLPNELPKRQDQFVIIYRLGTAASDTIDAIQHGIKTKSGSDSVYRALWRLNAAVDPNEAAAPHEEIRAKAVNATTAMMEVLELISGDKSSESDPNPVKADIMETVRAYGAENILPR